MPNKSLQIKSAIIKLAIWNMYNPYDLFPRKITTLFEKTTSDKEFSLTAAVVINDAPIPENEYVSINVAPTIWLGGSMATAPRNKIPVTYKIPVCTWLSVLSNSPRPKVTPSSRDSK